MVVPDTIFEHVLLVPAEARREVFERALQNAAPDSEYIDVLVEMDTDGPLTARHLGRWLNAINVGFAKFARLQGFDQPDLFIVEIGTGSFRATLRKINDVIALPGFLLGIYAVMSQGDPVDEETLRRVLAEQRPAATATADLFERDRVTEIRFSVEGRPLGRITAEDAQAFRAKAPRVANLPPRDHQPEFPAIPTWEAVLLRPVHLEAEPALLGTSDTPLGLKSPRPTFRNGTVAGTFFWIDRDPYVRLEGMEGVLVPVKASPHHLQRLQDRQAYHFTGEYSVRDDGVRTAFYLTDAASLGEYQSE